MVQAVLYQAPKNAMQSGQATTGQWFLEVEGDKPARSDALMGWCGGRSSTAQIKMKFSSKEKALEYAEKHYAGRYIVRELPDRFAPPAQSYSANFAFKRNGNPWTH